MLDKYASKISSKVPIYYLSNDELKSELIPTDEIIVKFLENISILKIDSINEKWDVRIIEKNKDYYLLKIPENSDAFKNCQYLPG